MIAEPVGLQAGLEFLVAVLAFAAIGVVVVGGLGQDERPGAVGDHRAAIGALGIRFALDDHPALRGPGLGPIPEGREQPLRLARWPPTAPPPRPAGNRCTFSASHSCRCRGCSRCPAARRPRTSRACRSRCRREDESARPARPPASDAPRTPHRPPPPSAGWAVPCSRQTATTRSFSAQVMTRGRY